MSLITKRVEDRNLCHIVECNDKYYYVDSVHVWDWHFETMAFECDENGIVYNWWRPWYVEEHTNAKEMVERHFEICTRLEDYLYNEDIYNVEAI